MGIVEIQLSDVLIIHEEEHIEQRHEEPIIKISIVSEQRVMTRDNHYYQMGKLYGILHEIFMNM